MSTCEEGDWTTPSVTVSPFDGTTVASLTIIKPDDTTTTVAGTTSGGGVFTAAAYELTMPGEWIERWTVTGTGKGKERRLIVSAADPATPPSGQRVYANTADLARHLRKANKPLPTNPRRTLLEASREIEQMTLTAGYATDTLGMPTDAEVIQAFRDATCMQAEFAEDMGDRNLVGANQYHSVSIASVQLTRAYGPGGSSAPSRWSRSAWQCLQRAGLVGQEPWSW